MKPDSLKANPVDSLICAVLREESPPWPKAGEAEYVEAFLWRSDYHGVSALLNERLHHSENWPADLRQAIHQRAIAQVVWELRHQQVITRVNAALARIGVQPVFLKGTALAYSLYPDPMLRARADTDIIIQPSERERVHDLLTTLGFNIDLGISGEFVSYQKSYTFTATDAGSHSIDLHLKINNSELLSRLFSYDELLEDAINLPKLCPDAVGVNPVYALLLACMHRCTHKQNPYYVAGVAYYSADRLIWIYDIHLLANAFCSDQWHDVMRLAGDKGLCAMCLDGIEQARTSFHTKSPEFLLPGLARSSERERPATYLNASELRQLWMDFLALEKFSGQLQFLQQLVFPPAAYMRTKYTEAQPGWLPWLYTRRALSGLAKMFKTSR